DALLGELAQVVIDDRSRADADRVPDLPHGRWVAVLAGVRPDEVKDRGLAGAELGDSLARPGGRKVRAQRDPPKLNISSSSRHCTPRAAGPQYPYRASAPVATGDGLGRSGRRTSRGRCAPDEPRATGQRVKSCRRTTD